MDSHVIAYLSCFHPSEEVSKAGPLATTRPPTTVSIPQRKFRKRERRGERNRGLQFPSLRGSFESPCNTSSARRRQGFHPSEEVSKGPPHVAWSHQYRPFPSLRGSFESWGETYKNLGEIRFHPSEEVSKVLNLKLDTFFELVSIPQRKFRKLLDRQLPIPRRRFPSLRGSFERFFCSYYKTPI